MLPQMYYELGYNSMSIINRDTPPAQFIECKFYVLTKIPDLVQEPTVDNVDCHGVSTQCLCLYTTTLTVQYSIYCYTHTHTHTHTYTHTHTTHTHTHTHTHIHPHTHTHTHAVTSLVTHCSEVQSTMIIC